MSSSTALGARDALVDALRHDLIGPMRADEILEQRPTRWYLAGFLVPRGTPLSDIQDPTDDEELSNAPDGDEDDNQGDSAVPAQMAWFPSSCGMSLIVGAEVESLEVEVSWGEYRQTTPLETSALWQQHRPTEWASRYGMPDDPTEAEADAAVAAEAAVSEDGGGEAPAGKKGRRRPPPPLWERQARHASAFPVKLVGDGAFPVPGGAGLVIRVETRMALAQGLPPGAQTVSVFLVNERAPVEGVKCDEQAIYQVSFAVRCASGLVPRTSFHQQDSQDYDELRVDLQYRDHAEWAVGHNISTEAQQDPDGQVRRVSTTWLPQASVWRMKTRRVEGVPMAMGALAALPGPSALRSGIEPLLADYTRWIAGQRGLLADIPEAGRREVGETLARAAERARDRISAGIGWLEQHPEGWEAFRLANLAMDRMARQARPELYADGKQAPSWRLFQLAFVLLNIQGIGDPTHPDRAVVELLFFPTGGGKTEAYLGVAAFTLALRRLRGQGTAHEGAGVAVLLRYTLRMLTLDQLGRAATLICALETLRREQPARLGRRPFQIGLWVGRSATPNRLEDAERQLSAYKANPQDRRKAPPMPLNECPWCQTEFTVNSYAILSADGQRGLRVGCVRDDCPFHFDESDDLGVPVVVIDEQIYRELPAFLIATVDKFAGLPRLGVAGTLFGKVQAKDGAGFYTDNAGVPQSATRFAGGLLPPELVLQDELHLITGPLGTMVGLYETVLAELARDRHGARPKLIASTATARGAGRQVQALYGARVVETFPAPGINPDDIYFAQNETDPAASRRYVGVAAPGRNMKAVAVRVYSALLSAAYRAWRRSTKQDENPIDTYMTLLSYFNTLRELGGTQRLIQEEVTPRCGRLQDRRPFQEDASTVFMNRSLSFEPLELTSRQTTDQIRLATARLRAPYQSDVGKRNDVVLASSMISVGVDIPRLGLMVMNGQPKTVAEYIQATSRVGRSTPGLVVTVLNLRRPRDRSHYERFTAFHDCFYRMVEAASVTPFSSRALDRGLAGVVVALARHLWASLGAPKKAQEVDRVSGLQARIQATLEQRVRDHGEDVPEELARQVGQRVAGLLNDWSQIAATMRQESVPLVYSPWEIKGGEPLLSTVLDPPRDDKDKRLKRFRAPTSMRDVESTVHIWAVSSLGGDEA